MNEELPLKLQAYADGELAGAEAAEMAGLVKRDAAARALLTELANTRNALAGFEAGIQLPESREFYWSKIERELRRLEAAEAPPAPAAWWTGWRRFFLPTGAVALLVILLAVGLSQFLGWRATAAESEFTLADSDGFTYHDYANGTTLVWLGYPAEKEFANLQPEDTLQ